VQKEQSIFQFAYYKTQSTNQKAERPSLAKHTVISKKIFSNDDKKELKIGKRSNVT